MSSTSPGAKSSEDDNDEAEGLVCRPRTRTGRVTADKAYSSRGNRDLLRHRGISPVIPEPSDQAGPRERTAPSEGVRSRTTPRPIADATSSSAHSTPSSRSAAWPPATTSSPSPTAAASYSHQIAISDAPIGRHALATVTPVRFNWASTFGLRRQRYCRSGPWRITGRGRRCHHPTRALRFPDAADTSRASLLTFWV